MIKNLATVLMPTYNAEKYLRESIESILNQNYQDFQFLIINDGSTDRSLEIIQSYQDARIKLVNHEKNLGLIVSLNNAIELIDSQYIARMDADDISHPQRLEIQLNFMQKNANVDICGCWIETFGENTKNKIHKLKPKNAQIKCKLLFDVPVIHATSIMKTQFLKQNIFNYDLCYPHSEDFDLWERISQKATFANISEPLYKVRYHPQKVSVLNNAIQLENQQKITLRQLQKLGISPTPNEMQIHHEVVNVPEEPITVNYLKRVNDWLCKIQQANQAKKIYPEPEMTETLAEIWYKVSSGYTKLGLGFWKIFKNSPLSEYHQYSLWQKVKFWIKCLLKY
jgi:glycosyltransferase involved in cell wall biosynthesis